MTKTRVYTKEEHVKKHVKEILNGYPKVFWYMPVQTGYGVRGIPDFVVCMNGRFIGIETKFGGNKETTWQQMQGAKIQAAGGLYIVIDEKNIYALEAILALEMQNGNSS
jgi:hypothetical protein